MSDPRTQPCELDLDPVPAGIVAILPQIGPLKVVVTALALVNAAMHADALGFSSGWAPPDAAVPAAVRSAP